MSIKIEKLILSFIAYFFIFYNCNGQELKGIYLLDHNNEHYYINLAGNSFSLFSLSENPNPNLSEMLVLNKIGDGVYEKTSQKISLKFDNALHYNPFYSLDSLGCLMYTKSASSDKTIEINLNISVPENGNNALIVKSYSKEYYYGIKANKLIITIPDSVIIKNLYVSVMGFDKRLLPFSEYYNTFKYDYYLNDNYPQVKIIKNEYWEFSIEAETRNYYKLNNKNYLMKADSKTIDFLKQLSNTNKQVNKVTAKWFIK